MGQHVKVTTWTQVTTDKHYVKYIILPYILKLSEHSNAKSLFHKR